MTRAADRLIVGGCMPGNRNEVSGSAFLVRPDRAPASSHSGLQMQEISERRRKFLVKRYARLGGFRHNDRCRGIDSSAGPIAPVACCRHGCCTAAPAEDDRQTVLLRPSDPEADSERHHIRTGRIP